MIGERLEVRVAAPGAREGKMVSLSGKKMVVIGGSRGIGRRIVEAGIRNGAQVLAVARQEAPLQAISHTRYQESRFSRSMQRRKMHLRKYLTFFNA